MVIDSEPTLPNTPPRTRQPGVASLPSSPDTMRMPGSWPGSNQDSNNDTSDPNPDPSTPARTSSRVIDRLTERFTRLARSPERASVNPFAGSVQLASQLPLSSPFRIAARPPLFRFSPRADPSAVTAPPDSPPTPPPDQPSLPASVAPTSAPIVPTTSDVTSEPAPKISSLPDIEPLVPEDESASLSPLSDKKAFELEDLKAKRLRLEEQLRQALEEDRLAKLAEERARTKARLARKAEEDRRAALSSFALRRPNAALITPLSREWDQRARRSIVDGVVNVPGPEGTDVSKADFARMVPETAWLNDNIIQACLASLARAINDAAGVKPKTDTPKCVVTSPMYWAWLRTHGGQGAERRFRRTWGVTPKNFLDIETFILPINHGSHWTAVVICPSRRTVAYVDSFRSSGASHLPTAWNFLRDFLGGRFKADEWKTITYNVCLQTNSYDCGMHVVTNSIYLALGLDPNNFTEDDMPLMRRWMAAMLLNGGFTGDFDLSKL